MTDLRTAAQQSLEACPFCGNEPSFSGDASEWKDESRYVELSLGCCVSMTEQIGWRRARDMTHEAKTAELRSRLQLRWNTRAALAEPVQQGCAHCNHPLYAATKCRVCGRVTEPTPPQRLPLTEEEIFKIENDIPDDVIGDRAWTICFARAVERAHKIGGEG